uniref:U-limacoditoxin(59)-Dv128 n=1 Tax=Doratifera vulnerans TaxID=1372962 RepID=U5928_DORVU|nr:RecName: Full=U-limacoditoxin(59)-Dv128; Short=U-LCTX(59)-Dv128; AltName: Full=Vulnericin; Contains: RecName: Full=U-LCTX(59)-Dv128 peptide 1; Contains: RecName: Full=U-LCTX(59)-Dv128 peptide 2; Contains: RecName: Full=U-LCTX(59)-Dv128 peptide 3; Flags: Precursor [Doratifera vulnerans]QTY40914.1 venom polypeptide precursor [Doratifera vulnerans]
MRHLLVLLLICLSVIAMAQATFGGGLGGAVGGRRRRDIGGGLGGAVGGRRRRDIGGGLGGAVGGKS